MELGWCREREKIGWQVWLWTIFFVVPSQFSQDIYSAHKLKNCNNEGLVGKTYTAFSAFKNVNSHIHRVHKLKNCNNEGLVGKTYTAFSEFKKVCLVNVCLVNGLVKIFSGNLKEFSEFKNAGYLNRPPTNKPFIVVIFQLVNGETSSLRWAQGQDGSSNLR